MSDSVYQAANNRYTCGMDYRRAGKAVSCCPPFHWDYGITSVM